VKVCRKEVPKEGGRRLKKRGKKSRETSRTKAYVRRTKTNLREDIQQEKELGGGKIPD